MQAPKICWWMSCSIRFRTRGQHTSRARVSMIKSSPVLCLRWVRADKRLIWQPGLLNCLRRQVSSGARTATSPCWWQELVERSLMCTIRFSRQGYRRPWHLRIRLGYCSSSSWSWANLYSRNITKGKPSSVTTPMTMASILTSTRSHQSQSHNHWEISLT